MTHFRFAATSFADLPPETVATLAAHAADLTLVLDQGGTVRDVSVPNRELAEKLGQPERWIGTGWIQTLHQASRAKAALFLSDAAAGREGSWHHFNHPGRDAGEVPLLYSASNLGAGGRILLFGRDLRPLSALQQRLIDAQHAMERDHGRIRQLELRHRLMLQGSPDPVLVVNAASQKIVEANAAMATLAETTPEALGGLGVLELFAPAEQARVAGVLMAARAAAPHDSPVVGLRDGTRMLLGVTLFHDDGAALLLLRLRPEAGRAQSGLARIEAPSLLRLIEQTPDAYVVTDANGRVLGANEAFQKLAEIPRPRELVGQPLDRWLGRGGPDLDVLMANLRQRGTVRLFNSTLVGGSGLATAVEISAASLAEGGEGALFGFALRDIERRVSEAKPGRDLPRSVDQLTELIGRVPLKDLVREATDMIERLCIEAALETTGDNRASAAELLGLSRQSLYVKLHRYGLGDLADAPGG